MKRRGSLLFRAIELWRYYQRAQTVYSLHAPLAYELVKHMLEERNSLSAAQKVKAYRRNLRQDKGSISTRIYNTSEPELQFQNRKIRILERRVAVKEIFGNWLLHLCAWCQPQRILELGTSLGVGTSYMHLGAPEAAIWTLEGCPNVAAFAQKQFERLKYRNIQVKSGLFEETLQKTLKDHAPFDFIYLDGDHQKNALLRNFALCWENLSDESILVLDDIYWSPGMKEAWHEICAKEKVLLTIDLFQFGLVIRSPKLMQKQHHTVIPTPYKPWHRLKSV